MSALNLPVSFSVEISPALSLLSPFLSKDASILSLLPLVAPFLIL
jgi:hypothetical protein